LPPKHIRSLRGKELFVVSKSAVNKKDIKASSKILETDFKNMSVKTSTENYSWFLDMGSYRCKGGGCKKQRRSLKRCMEYGAGMERGG
jgi:hypothetical protein